jgi:hypothetical protein
LNLKSRPTHLIGLALALLACSVFSPQATPMNTRPDDFSARYDWYEGSLPPPYHYEYSIEIGADGAGTVEMVPNYPSEDVPVWTETFTVGPEALDAVYRQLAEHGAFTTRWREEEDPPVGGSHFATTLTANGETVTIPSFVVADQTAAQGEISAAIVGLVPQDIWDKLEGQREQYVEEHSE